MSSWLSRGQVGRWLSGLCLATCFTACSSGDFAGYKYRPYTVRGVRYYPLPPDQAPGYVEEGIASHYREGWFIFPGKTALGENLWPWTRTGAHKTLPLPCTVRVINLRNGRSVKLRLNDRGPFIAGRTLDVTGPVAKDLGFYDAGLAPVRVEVLSVGDGRWRIKERAIPRALPAAPVTGAISG